MKGEKTNPLGLQDYEVIEELYFGKRSRIYKARRVADNSVVIIKTHNQEYPDQSEIQQLIQEFEFGSRLSCDFVNQYISIEKVENGVALIMEYIDGNSLNLLMKEETFTITDFLSIACLICDGLAAIHAARIIHKDINPSNIILNRKTGQLKIIDFDISTELVRQNVNLEHPDVLEGTLHYISPEQTGRMNRKIDYRSDLYSLGATFYELLTGSPPFDATDAMEIVHCHLARTPKRVNEVNPAIPKVISDIVMKLLLKTAEERYKSALGVKADLLKCLERLKRDDNDEIEFEIAQDDFSNQFQIPQKLYGRERNIDELLEAFKRISEHNSELLLVTGYSGVGKSSLVREVHKPIAEKKGYFIEGKFDQSHQNIPYSAISQAFGEFVSFILTEPELSLKKWKEKILSAVGGSGKVLIDVIPSLELIIGKQPEVPPLGDQETLNRFNLIFQNFAKVTASHEHPLVIFLDDLQWIDSASLKLIKLILTDPDLAHLLLVGAYRDNEVDPSHILNIAMEELKQQKIPIKLLKLSDLPEKAINDLVADSLHCDHVQSLELARLLFSKTSGNAFFLHQMLDSLNREELLYFNTDQKRWEWEIEAIKSKNIADNVVELTVRRIQSLPFETQNLLTLASCIGNAFDTGILSLVAGKEYETIQNDIRIAIHENMIIPLKDSCKFAHDRIQQACYSLISIKERERVHLQTGRLILRQASGKEQKLFLYDAVNQLNKGIPLLETEQEKTELAQLNLMAGEKSRSETAYESAVRYLTQGMELLSPDSWTDDYALSFAFHTKLAECDFLVGNAEGSEKLFDMALDKAATDLEKAEIYATRLFHYMSLGRHVEAIEAGREGLRLCHVNFPENDKEVNQAIQLEGAQIESHPGSITQTIINAPEMENEEKIICMTIFPNLAMSSYLLSRQNLFVLTVLQSVNMTLRYGQADLSAIMCAWNGVLLAGQGRYKESYEFGALSMDLAEKYQKTRQKAMCYNVAATAALHFGIHLRQSVSVLSKGYKIGFESGDISSGLFCYCNTLPQMMAKGDPLPLVAKQADGVINDSRKHNVSNPKDFGVLYREFALSLMKNREENSLSDETFSNDFIERQKKSNHITFLLHFRLQKAFWFENYESALIIAEAGETGLLFTPGYIIVFYHYFFKAMILLQLYSSRDDAEKESYRQKIDHAKQVMSEWVESCPSNFSHHYLLIQAEEARLFGTPLEAMELYDKSIKQAKEQAFFQIVALANEFAARFYLSRELKKVARGYMAEAYYYYKKWGSDAKIQDLEKRYPQLLKQKESIFQGTLEMDHGTLLDCTGSRKGLDLETVIKASHAISEEIVLTELLKKLMQLVLENAGAEQGALILNHDGQWYIEAEGNINETDVSVLQSKEIANSQSVSDGIIHYVARTLKQVVLNDAGKEGKFIGDPHIVRKQSKSVLCMPLINQGKPSGILYLENNLSTHVFTSKRLELLNLLSSQMAVALDNARLYDEMIKNAQLASQLSKAKLDVLRLQLNPHFLFNTLNMISSIMYDDVYQADKILTRLSDLLRNILSRSKQQTVTLEEEFELFQHYVEIMKARFAEKLIVDISMDSECKFALSPGFFVQPIVENSIKHGMSSDIEILKITIRVRKKESRVELIIRDNGTGLSDDPETLLSKGTGLSSNLERFELMYKNDFSFNLANSVQGGTIVTIEIPFQTKSLQAEE